MLACLLRPHKKGFDMVKRIINSVQYSKKPTFSYRTLSGSKHVKQVKIGYLRCMWTTLTSSEEVLLFTAPLCVKGLHQELLRRNHSQWTSLVSK